MTSTVEGYAVKKLHYRGSFVSPVSLAVQSTAGAKVKVFMTTKTAPSTVVDAAGKTVETIPADSGSFVFSLEWTANAWRVSSIQSSA